MKKFLAVVKREYVQRVRTKFFVVATVLGPLLTIGFTVVAPLMIGMKTGGPTRIAIVDQTGKMYERVTAEINQEENRAPSQPTPLNVPGSTSAQDQARQAAARTR